MVNQQQLDYIKQQLQQGVSREQIKSSLMANGWQEKDIEEGFNAINISVPAEQYSDFSTKAPMKMWKIITALLIVILLIGGEVYFVTQKIIKPGVTSPTPINETQTSQPTQPTMQPTQPVTDVLVDCGSVGPSNPGDEEKVKGCFEPKFKDCKPVKMVMSIDMGPLGGLMTYYYEIIGPNNNLCSVKSKFLKNPNLDWVGKEMICNYDNTKNFDVAVQDFIGKCSGPLYTLMTEGMQLHSNSNCTLKTAVTKIELLKGVSSSITAAGFKGTESQVSWNIVDKNIATASPSSGKMTMLKPISTGSTQLIVTDVAVGSDCFVSVPITIK